MGNTRRRWTIHALALVATTLASSLAVHAQVQAYLRLEAIGETCLVDSWEGAFDNSPERYWRIGLFDSDDAGVLGACAIGCDADSISATLDGQTTDSCSTSNGCFNWNVPDTTIAKIAPDGQGVWVYIGLFDQDVDDDDSLGDHWVYVDSRLDWTGLNNNLAPYNVAGPLLSVCGNSLEGPGNAGNFEPTFEVWFRDQSAPVPPLDPRAHDDGYTEVQWDNDGVLSFSWTPGQDPHSGISGHTVSLWSQEDGSLHYDAPVEGDSVSFCSGCPLALSAVHGRQYVFQAHATNGAHPGIDNAQTRISEAIGVRVDLVNPVTDISPPPQTWWNDSFSLDVDDSDSGSGIDPGACEYRVLSDGEPTVSWTVRPCGGSIDLGVGPGQPCRDEGPAACRVQARSRDVARRNSATAFRSISIDFTPDPLGAIAGTASGGGWPVFDGVWQRFPDVDLEWVTPISAAPIAGFSDALDAAPDCAPDLSESQRSLTELPEGATTFRVRALDAAGNCGEVASFEVRVDSVADAIEDLEAFSQLGGTPIPEGVPQPDDDPYLTWSAPGSTSPILGYVVGVDSPPPCLGATTVVPSFAFGDGALSPGDHTLYVRARDEAGNCGPTSSFAISVDPALLPGAGATHSVRIGRAGADPDSVRLTWDGSCGAGTEDYAVYSGALGDWSAREVELCSTDGALSADVTRGGDRFYLVVPLSSTAEGSYGATSAGLQRTPAIPGCLPQEPPDSCP